MDVKPLTHTSFEEVFGCFLAAFEGYFVKMPEDKSYFEKRWKAANVDFDYSYGMFDQGNLVGFIIHGIDTRKGVFTAFNTGTGVIPAYRGRRVVKSIYDIALPDLRQKGIEKTNLEVITKNTKAIRAYQEVGFNTCLTYKCFNGIIKLDAPEQVTVQAMELSQVDWEALPNQHVYSWDNQKESLLQGDFRFFQVLHNKQLPESFFILNSALDYVAQFDVLKEERNAWTRLFSGIRQLTEKIKINNVQTGLHDKLNSIRAMGLDNTIDQFEMELSV